MDKQSGMTFWILRMMILLLALFISTVSSATTTQRQPIITLTSTINSMVFDTELTSLSTTTFDIPSLPTSTTSTIAASTTTSSTQTQTSPPSISSSPSGKTTVISTTQTSPTIRLPDNSTVSSADIEGTNDETIHIAITIVCFSVVIIALLIIIGILLMKRDRQSAFPRINKWKSIIASNSTVVGNSCSSTQPPANAPPSVLGDSVRYSSLDFQVTTSDSVSGDCAYDTMENRNDRTNESKTAANIQDLETISSNGDTVYENVAASNQNIYSN